MDFPPFSMAAAGQIFIIRSFSWFQAYFRVNCGYWSSGVSWSLTINTVLLWIWKSEVGFLFEKKFVNANEY